MKCSSELLSCDSPPTAAITTEQKPERVIKTKPLFPQPKQDGGKIPKLPTHKNQKI
jgi:hypothetical protein